MVEFQTESRASLIIRWTARASAAALLLMVVAFAVGEGVPDPRTLTTPEVIQFLAFGVLLAGLLAGFRREVLGGALVLLGLMAFSAFNYVATGRVPRGAFPYFIVPGVLFLVSGRISQQGTRAKRA